MTRNIGAVQKQKFPGSSFDRRNFMKKNFCVAAAFLAVFALIFTACPGDDGNNGGNNGGQTGGGEEPAGLIHQWMLDGDGNDSVGTATLTMNGLGMKANNPKVPGNIKTFPWLSFFGGPKGDSFDDLVIDISKMNSDLMQEAAFAWGGRTLLLSGGTHGPDWAWDGCYVEGIDTSGINNELSATLWMWMGDVGGHRNILILEKPTSINGGQHLITTTAGGYIYLGYSLDIDSCIDLDTPVGSYKEEWVHLALIWKGDSVTLYVNAVKAGEIIGEIPLAAWWNEDGTIDGVTLGKEMVEPVRLPNLDFFKIGGQQPAQHFVGLMTDVRLYNRALTPADVKYLVDQAPQAVKELGAFE
jgi:hypothetical protein